MGDIVAVAVAGLLFILRVLPFIDSLVPYPFTLRPKLMGGGTRALPLPLPEVIAEGPLEVGVDMEAVSGGVRTD